MTASRAGSTFRFEMRSVAYAASALAGLVTLVFAAVGVNDARVAAVLRARGVIAQGQRTGESCSDSRNGRGFTTRSCVGLWSYRTATGERLTMQDLGAGENGPAEVAPGWAPPRDGQIAYLADRPGTARLRTQIAPRLLPLLAGGGLFLLLAVVFFAAGRWLLGSTRATRERQPLSVAASRRRERRGEWIVRAMVIGVPLAVLAGLFLI